MSSFLRDIVLRFSGEDAGLGRSLASVGKSAKEAEDSIESIGKRASSVGGVLNKGVTLPLAAVAGAATKFAIDYESAFAGVRKTVDMTEAEFEGLYEATLAMSETKPVSATQIMAIEELGGQLGIASDSLLDFADVISDVTASTNLGLEDAATQFAQFANITGMSQGDFDRLGSTLVDLGNNAATTEGDIMAMAMRIAGAGTSAGMSVTDIMAMSTTLSSLGINAEAGGTAISTIISNIDKAVATNGDTLETWAETWATATGRSASEFAAAWGDDPVVALEQVIEGMASMQDEGGNLSVLLDSLGVTSIRQTDAFKRMANSGDLFNETLARSRSAWDANSALATEVGNRYGTTESKLAMLRNRMTNVASTLGGPLAEALVAAIDAAQPLIDGIAAVAQGFADMDPDAQRFIITMAGVATAAGPVLSAVGGVADTITKLSDAFGLVPDGSKAKGAIEGLSDAADGAKTKISEAASAVGDLNGKRAGDVARSVQGVGTAASGTTDSAAGRLAVAADAVDDLNKRTTGDVTGEVRGVGTAASGTTDSAAGRLTEAAGAVDTLDTKTTSGVTGEIGNVGAAAAGSDESAAGRLTTAAEAVGDLDGRTTGGVTGEIGKVTDAAGEGGAAGKISDAAGAVDALNGKGTGTVTTEIGNIETTADTARGRISDAAGEVDALNGKTTSGVTAEIGNVEAAAENTRGKVSDAAGEIGSLDGEKVSGVAADADRAKTSTAKVSDNVESIGKKSVDGTATGMGTLADNSERAAGKTKDTNTNLGNIEKKSQGIGKASTAIGKITTAAGLAASAVGTVLSTALITLAGAAVIASIEYVATKISEARKQSEDWETALAGVSTDITNLDTSKLSDAAEPLNDISKALSDGEGSLQSLVEGHLETIEGIKQSWSDLSTDSALVDMYVGTIERLADRSDLSAAEQAELKVAIEGVNDVCGEGTVVIDEQTGAIVGGAAAVREATKAWRDYALVQGYQSTIADLSRDLAATQVAIAQQEETVAAAQAEVERLIASDSGLANQGLKTLEDYVAARSEAINGRGFTAKGGGSGAAMAWDAEHSAIKDAIDALNGAQGQLAETQELYNSQVADIDRWTGAMGEAIEATGEFGDVMDRLSGVDRLGDVLGESNRSVEDFAHALTEAGVSADALANVTDSDLRLMAAGWDGTVDGEKGVLALLAEYGVALDEAAQDTEQATSQAAQAADDAAKQAEEAAKRWVESWHELTGGSRAFEASAAGMGMTVDEMGRYLMEAGVDVDAFAEKYRSLADVGNPLSEIAQQEFGLGELRGNLDANIAIMSDWSDNVVALYGRAGDQATYEFVSYIESLGPQYAPLVDEIVNMTDDELAELVASWDTNGLAAANSARDNTRAAIEAIERVFGEGSPEAEAAARELAQSAAAGTEGMADEMGADAAEAGEAVADGIESGASGAQASGETLASSGLGGLETLPDEMEARGKVAGYSFAAGIGSQESLAATKAGEVSHAAALAMIGDLDNAESAGRDTAWKFANGISQRQGDASAAGYWTAWAAVSAMGSVADHAYSIGANITRGLASGISDPWAAMSVASAASSVVSSAIATAKAVAGIASPSKVMAEVGRFWGEGLARGIADSEAVVDRAASSVMRAALLDGYTARGANGLRSGTVYNLYVDGATVNDVGYVQDSMRDFLYGLRRIGRI